MIEVGVLGPLEVRAGESVALGGYQQQAVLAMLVTARGRVGDAVPAARALAEAEPLRGEAWFLTALGVPDQRVPPSLDERVALFRSVLAGRRMLVLLDNAAETDQVRPLLPGTHGCTVAVTSRNQLAGLVVAEGAYPLRLDAFDDEEARGYLRRRLGSERTDDDPAARDEIVARCGGLPLALAVVCARAITRDAFSLEAIAAELRDTGLDAFTVEGFSHDPRSVFSWSYRQLPAPAAALFRRLALHPGPDGMTCASTCTTRSPWPGARWRSRNGRTSSGGSASCTM